MQTNASVQSPASRGSDCRLYVVGLLLAAYVLLLVLGTLTFHSPAAMPRGNEMGWDRAVFSAVNAGSLTGFQPFVTAAQYMWLGRAATFVLIIGGILFALIAGGMLAVRVLRLPYGLGQIVGSAVTCIAVATFLGAMFAGEPGQPLAGVFSGAAALGNCGLTLGPAPGLMDWRTQLILLPLAVGGGLGLPVLMQTAGWLGGRNRLDGQTRTVWAWTAGMYLLGVALFAGVRYLDPAGWSGTAGLGAALGAASAASLDTRTFGLPLSFAAMFPAVSLQWIAMPLMAIGASSAGTGGGIKTTTVHVLFGGVRRAFGGRSPGRLFGIAAVWIGVYGLCAFACVIALLITQPQMAADRLLFLSISAMSNVGLSKDPISMTGMGLYILSAAMLAGRLLPMVILGWTAWAVKDAELAVA